MKKLLLLTLLLFSTVTLFSQEKRTITATKKSFPTNFNKDHFLMMTQFEGKEIAFDGIIEDIRNSRNNTPFYKIRLGEDEYLWTVLMFNNEKNKMGDTIRVLGKLRQTNDLNEEEKKYLEGDYMVIASGLVDFKNAHFLFFEGADTQKNAWLEGQIIPFD